ncbi:MAG: hypothetical protein IPL78_27305 [Chloroflexi bacterium]|nr:hypothetical protein [Chloroflexota bacterium]
MLCYPIFPSPPVPVLAALKQLLAWSDVSVSRDEGLRGRAQARIKRDGKLTVVILLTLFVVSFAFAFAPMWMSFMAWGAEEQAYFLNLIAYQIPAIGGILALLAGIGFMPGLYSSWWPCLNPRISRQPETI